MKKTGIIAVLCTMIILASCDDDFDFNSKSAQEKASLTKETVQSGEWVIAKFIDDDDDDDYTEYFASYTFQFSADGNLTATDGTNTITGKWSITTEDDDNDDDGDDDDGDDDDKFDDDDDDIDFNIYFSSPAIFNELSEDWDIISVSSSKIQLKDDDDFLTFEKR